MIIEHRRGQRGLTLVELLIALVIVGILTSVAFPLYTRYQQRSYRSQAMTDLGDCAMALERFYTENFTYAGANLATLCTDVSPPSGTALYDLTLPAANATGFTLRATPVAGAAAAGDGLLELDASGARRWDKDDDGDVWVGGDPANGAEAGEDNWEE